MKKDSFKIEKLGDAQFRSPLGLSRKQGDHIVNFMPDNSKIYSDIVINNGKKSKSESETMELAGPREKIYFDPHNVKAAIVTCGGLCPGLNDVIRAIVMELVFHYGIREIFGIRYGYAGLNPANGFIPVKLTPNDVESVHEQGGTILGSSRGDQDVTKILDFLETNGINQLYTIGGDGTQRGALEIYREAERRGYDLAVIGIPKTIDNDISYVERSFGFETAFSIASRTLDAGHAEAKGVYNGVALVRLMGRNSGYLAAMASLASGDANFVLVPEVEFDLDGSGGFLAALENRLRNRHHALVVVAEGAGQALIGDDGKVGERDASGNLKLHDIGLFLKDRISSYLREKEFNFSLKYIDPSYIVRSAPANPTDRVYCLQLAQNAVHAAMSGRTAMLVGVWNSRYVHVPLALAVEKRKNLDPEGALWLSVVEATGQPLKMTN